MISKARIKQIKALERKKERTEQGLFIAEGPKLVGELLAVAVPQYVATTELWLEQNRHKLPPTTAVDIVSEEELRRASLQQHPQSVIALFPTPREDEEDLLSLTKTELMLALDGVQDPGNIGTIVRIADWFGIRHILCSTDCADIFNPKATQATMGALARVRLHYTDLPQFLSQIHSPIYGTFLDGENIYRHTLTQHGVIVMGNEGRGISTSVAKHVSQRLLIPPYPANRPTVESLNVAIATAIVCAEFRRNTNGNKE